MNPTYKGNFLKAGKIAGEVREYGASLIKIGASYNDVIAAIKTKIAELGAKPAFPPQIAINGCAAHFLPAPGEDVIFDETMIVSLDVGVSVDGAIGDCAKSIDLTGNHQDLVDASREALLAAQRVIKVGLTLGELGKAIDDEITKRGFTSIKNLSGHGLGEYIIHTKPSIPNYNNESNIKIEPGMTFAVEPFASTGTGYIHENGEPHIFSLVTKKPVRADSSRAAMKKILTFNGLPFSTHDLIDKKLPYFKVKFALRELQSVGAIHGHPPLVEEGEAMVTQAENTILVDEDGNVIVTTE